MCAVAKRPSLVFEDALIDKHMRAIIEDRPMAHFRLKPLDDILGGIYPGQMIGVGAMPGCGKTSLMLQAADELAWQGQPVIYVSGELPPHKLVAKSLVRLCTGKLRLSDIPHAADDPAIAEEIGTAAREYIESIAPNLCITESCTVADLGRLVSSCIAQRDKVPVVIIDYLQLLATSGADPFADERLAIAACVKGLRETANSYLCPIFLISTITRTAYAKKKPDLAAFGGSAMIEYSLDAALFLSVADEDAPAAKRPITLTALKNRYGSQCYTDLVFDAPHATFFAGE